MAVNVTGCKTTAGLGVEATETVVAAWLIVKVCETGVAGL